MPSPRLFTPYVGAAVPPNEDERLEALYQYKILDTEPEEMYDDIASLASAICDTPIALVSFTDRNRQWYKANIGFDAGETPRDIAFCPHALLSSEPVFVVPNALKDRRFARNPLVIDGQRIHFYAGAPLVTSEGLAIGTLCVMDTEPRELVQREREALRSLARQVVTHLEVRRTITNLEAQSMTDALTGAWNQRAFDRHLRGEWKRHLRSATSLGLLRFDVDRFNQINEKLGNRSGFQILVQVVRAAEGAMRESDFMARSGGDDFSVILPNTDLNGARVVAERIRAAITRIEWSKREVTVSVGVSVMVPSADANQTLLVAQAAEALAHAKRAGRNKVEVFDVG